MIIGLFERLGLRALPLTLGLALFAASLTPSLIPRDWVFQGALGGLLTALGYLIGRCLQLLWLGLGLRPPQGRWARIAAAILWLAALALWIWALARSVAWQNDIRERLTLPPLESSQWAPMLALAIAVFAACFLLGLVVQALFRLLRARLHRVMPPRSANLLGALLAGVLLVLLTTDGLGPALRRGMEDSYAEAQSLFDTAPPAPRSPDKAGGPGSLVDWEAMGQPGRDFILKGPTGAEISALTGRPAKDPIRVYVGRAQDEDPASRAQTALDELIRLKAFEREILVVASPTGTGWLDPNAMDTLDYLAEGDIAAVGVQYSYLQSPLALIFETATGLDQASATFRAIYRHWKDLPRDARPRLYLHGLSLGAWSSMYSLDLFEVFSDPIQGAFWAGPPFVSAKWRRITEARDPSSLYVLPTVADGALVRFMSQFEGPDRAAAPWSDVRVIYLQYASDAIVFYEPASLWRAPQWMREPRAPDVSPKMRFIPVVTQFQLALDMMLAAGVPPGFGHAYAAKDYAAGWRSLLGAQAWTEADMTALIALCARTVKPGCAPTEARP